MTCCIEQSIDAFQRRLLRSYVLNVRYPRIVKNEDIYNLTKQQAWSSVIRQRRLNWFGHLIRLPDNAPARIAFQYAMRPYQRPVGRPKTTWISVIKKDLKNNFNINLEQATEIAKNRQMWRRLIGGARSS